AFGVACQVTGAPCRWAVARAAVKACGSGWSRRMSGITTGVWLLSWASVWVVAVVRGVSGPSSRERGGGWVGGGGVMPWGWWVGCGGWCWWCVRWGCGGFGVVWGWLWWR